MDSITSGLFPIPHHSLPHLLSPLRNTPQLRKIFSNNLLKPRSRFTTRKVLLVSSKVELRGHSKSELNLAFLGLLHRLTMWN